MAEAPAQPTHWPVRCRKKDCRLVLGFTDDRRLWTGPSVYDRPQPLVCQACGTPRVWHPNDQAGRRPARGA